MTQRFDPRYAGRRENPSAIYRRCSPECRAAAPRVVPDAPQYDLSSLRGANSTGEPLEDRHQQNERLPGADGGVELGGDQGKAPRRCQ
jgi:hypothetical protein